MHIVLIPDSFKDSLTATEVATAMSAGIRKVLPDAQITHITASDGGEGFLNAVSAIKSDLKFISSATVDPLGRKLTSEFLFSESEKVAFIELAKASGLELLSTSERNPLKTSTFGTGLQIKQAKELGVKLIYVGLGGSATNDAGTGIAKAMGYRFVDAEGKEVDPIGGELGNIEQVISPQKSTWDFQIKAINDVDNPLFGPEGAAYTYAGQKGANRDEITFLDKNLKHLSSIVLKHLSIELAGIPGSGAAGGTAYGLKTFFDAEYIPGVSFMLALSGFERLLSSEKIDLILTGEGSIDKQTKHGKLLSGVSNAAQLKNIPVAAICGKLNLDPEGVSELGLFDVRELFDPAMSVNYSYDHAALLVKQHSSSIISDFQLATLRS